MQQRFSTFPVFLANIFLAGIFFCLPATAMLAQSQNRYDIRFASIGRFNHAPDVLSGSEVLPGEMTGGYFYRIIQFDAIPTQAQQEAIAAAGIGLIHYVPNFAYIAAFPAGFDCATLADMQPTVRLLLPIDASFKMSRRIQEGGFPDWAWVGNKAKITLQYHKTATVEDVINHLVPFDVEVVGQDAEAHALFVLMPQAAIASIAALPAVYTADIGPAPGYPEEERARAMHRNNLIDSDLSTGRKYNGTGVSVGVHDDGMIGPHIDFTGRTDQTAMNGNDPATATHGDMTNGIVGGAGNLNPRMRGMATGTFLHVLPYNSLLPYTFNLHTTKNVMVFSTSYSDGCNAGYTAVTQKVDDEIFANPSLMQVFSAGNNGTVDCGYGAGSIWGNITGGHKMAKNCIAAANLNTSEIIESSSSRGPATDGRIKPDIASNGQNQISTDPNNTYAVGGGTSAACPGIAGTLAQLYQAYRTLNAGANPPSALLKACLLNTTFDMGNKGPDFIYGWGRVNAYRALLTLEDSRYQTGTATQGTTQTHAIAVPAGLVGMRVMVYWADPEASTVAATALINDLDMTMLQPNGPTPVLPYLLDYRPGFLSSPATVGVDSINNVEQIEIANPVAGTYTISIDGHAVPQGPQAYYLVYEFLGESVAVTYPNGGEGFVPGVTERICWDAYGNTGTFSVDYSANNGASWTAISSGIQGTKRFIDWIVPASALTDFGRVRVRRGVDTATSAAPFTILGVSGNIDVIQMCPYSATIAWDNVQGASAYELYLLGSKYMEVQITTPDNFATIPVTNVMSEKWMAVRAIGANGGMGMRSLAVRYAGGLKDCVILNDLQAAAIVSPGLGSAPGCTGSAQAIQVAIANIGFDDQSQFDVFVQVDAQAPVFQAYTGTLAAGAIDTLTFLNAGTFTINTLSTVRAWSSLSFDQLPQNDTISMPVQVLQGSVKSLPYSETFETFSLCSGTDTCEKGICPLAEGWYNEPTNFDGQDWRTFAGATPSPNTGPSTDHTTFNATGKYLYLEANACFRQSALAFTPCLDLQQANAPQLSFWSHTTGIDMGELHVDVFSDGKWILDVVPMLAGNKSNSWINRKVALGAFVGKIITIRFRGITGNGYRSDMAIDDITVDDLTGIASPLAQGIHVWPNPAGDVLHVDADAAFPIRFALYNAQGKEIQALFLQQESVVELAKFPAGLYHWVGTCNGVWVASGKIVKE